MKHLSVLNQYFWKYKKLFLFGVVFILISNYFRILSPQVAGFVVDEVQNKLQNTTITTQNKQYDWLLGQLIQWFNLKNTSLQQIVIICSLTLLLLALLGGIFMFLMRQTIIVMSRHIEYEQKNEIFKKYLALDTAFYKVNATGDLMNRIAEDVSRVRMYTGPAIMYFINLAATIGFSIYFMVQTNVTLTLYVLAPLPVLAVIIYLVNSVINKKSELIQEKLSQLTSAAQESYSGIRIIKSFAQEQANQEHFNKLSSDYRNNAVSLAKIEALYFPSMTLLIGISTLLTVAIGSWYVVTQDAGVTAGTITEFVVYINMLTFPVSAIGWTASITQRAAASQKRINEFTQLQPSINPTKGKTLNKIERVDFEKVSLTYNNTGITALKNIQFSIQPNEKILLIGKTGSGKSSIAQLLTKMFEANEGNLLMNGISIKELSAKFIREHVGYVQQDVFLFSDTIQNNIAFGLNYTPTLQQIENAAKMACVHDDILGFEKGYDTIVGERGITLSGGQKQRISIARALLKECSMLILDDCLSAVDNKTEHSISQSLNTYCVNKTLLVIAHRIPTGIQFNKIITLQKGVIEEMGTHEQLITRGGFYAALYNKSVHQD